MLAESMCTLEIRGQEINLSCFEFDRHSKVRKKGSKLTLTEDIEEPI